MSKPTVFVSTPFDPEGADWVRRFVDALRKQEVNVWSDQSIRQGEEWGESIRAALQACDLFVGVLSPQNAYNRKVYFEMGAAVEAGKRLIPILSEDFERAGVPFVHHRRTLTKGLPEVAAREVASALKEPAAA